MPKVKEFVFFTLQKIRGAACKTQDFVRGQGAREVKKRSVLGVHEHFSPTSNAAIGQKMGFTSGSEEFIKDSFCRLYYVSFG